MTMSYICTLLGRFVFLMSLSLTLCWRYSFLNLYDVMRDPGYLLLNSWTLSMRDLVAHLFSVSALNMYSDCLWLNDFASFKPWFSIKDELACYDLFDTSCLRSSCIIFLHFLCTWDMDLLSIPAISLSGMYVNLDNDGLNILNLRYYII